MFQFESKYCEIGVSVWLAGDHPVLSRHVEHIDSLYALAIKGHSQVMCDYMALGRSHKVATDNLVKYPPSLLILSSQD